MARLGLSGSAIRTKVHSKTVKRTFLIETYMHSFLQGDGCRIYRIFLHEIVPRLIIVISQHYSTTVSNGFVHHLFGVGVDSKLGLCKLKPDFSSNSFGLPATLVLETPLPQN